jgi:methyl-accepting chemotaxis protein
MQEHPAQVRRFVGLRTLGMFFRIVAFICLVITILIASAAIVAMVTNPANGVGAASTAQGTLGQAIPFAFWALVAYAASQVIDVVLSINDNLRKLARPGQESARELQQTAEEMSSQTRKITALLEQHHRRLDRLESRQ